VAVRTITRHTERASVALHRKSAGAPYRDAVFVMKRGSPWSTRCGQSGRPDKNELPRPRYLSHRSFQQAGGPPHAAWERFGWVVEVPDVDHVEACTLRRLLEVLNSDDMEVVLPTDRRQLPVPVLPLVRQPTHEREPAVGLDREVGFGSCPTTTPLDLSTR
jgi:hypothetical protein